MARAGQSPLKEIRVNVDVLITGGAGFIGCALATHLLGDHAQARSMSIAAVDNLHPQVHLGSARPAALPDAVALHVMDVRDRAAWDSLLATVRPRVIVHLAAETGTAQSFDFPVSHTDTNVNGTAQMLEALNRAKHIPEHIVLTSSRAVYGEGAWQDASDGTVFQPANRSRRQLEAGQFAILTPTGSAALPLRHRHDRVQPKPTSIYGATKLAQEHLLAAWCGALDVPLSILRLQNVYGVGQSPHNPYTGIIGLFHRVAAAGAAIDVYEDGEIGRDFIYIDDVVRALGAAIARMPAGTSTIDVGSGEAMTIHRAAIEIAALYNAPSPAISGAFRFGDVRWAVSDSTELKAQFGLSALVSFAEGNRHLSAWLKQTGVIAS